MKRYTFLLVAFTLVISSCKSPEPGPYVSIAGFTQGTSYHMTYQSPVTDSLDLTEEVDAKLAEFDRSLSTYIESSLISRINRNETDSTDIYFRTVFDEALRVYAISGGAFDITVGPLIDAWGFGPGRKLEMSERVVDSILKHVGMEKVQVEDDRIVKLDPGINFDMNAIAQGYAVDVICDMFDEMDIPNYMVEIGGEIRAKGVSHRGVLWNIGIDKPAFGNMMPGMDLQAVVKLDNKALASSGNYRKYYEVDGRKIVHTIDPKTGYSRESNLLSATIITDKCITADALATACMSKGLEEAMAFITLQDNVEAFLVYTDDDGLFLEWMTEGMKELISH